MMTIIAYAPETLTQPEPHVKDPCRLASGSASQHALEEFHSGFSLGWQHEPRPEGL